MVYCGKLSKGCQHCRSKRLKCDQKRPGCGQCKNTGRTCLGYRNTDDLIFRDESQRITIKFQTAETRQSSATETVPSGSNAHASSGKVAKLRQRPTSLKQPQVPQSLSEPVQDVAISFLLGDYIRGSHFDYLPALYNTEAFRGILSPVVKAVGLASLALQTARPALQSLAQKFYVEAIANTNLALQSTDTAQHNDVLAAILLLSLYETLTFRTHISYEAWATHMQGALTLVALRGPALFASKLGLELFKQIAASIRVFCVQRPIRVPQQLRELTLIAGRYAPPDDVSFKVPRAVEAFTDLRVDMAEGVLTEPDEIIAHARDVLDVLEELQSTLPSGCSYHTVGVNNPSPEIHGDYFHVFQNHHVAQTWNTIWMAMMQLNILIHEQLLRSLDQAEELRRCSTVPGPVLEACRREVVKAVDNICASVPQFFPPNDGQRPVQNSRTAAMGYFLIWPLFTAGSTSLISPSTRDYVVDRLEFIAQDRKLPQAHVAAEMLVQDECVEHWMHIYHVF